jgi:excisionase family DNA binding protein
VQSHQLLRAVYTPAEAANVLGISRKQVYRLIAEGILPAVKYGPRDPHWHIPHRGVEDLLGSGTASAATAEP